MKKETVVATFMSLVTALGFAQTPQKVDGWSIYSVRGEQNTTLLETSSLEPLAAGAVKLDVVCTQGKLYRVALQTPAAVPEQALNYNRTMPTTAVFLQADAAGTQAENWAVLDDGHTVSPYAEVRLGKRNRAWVERLAGVETLAVEFRGGPQAAPVRAHFATSGLSKALAAAGCSY